MTYIVYLVMLLSVDPAPTFILAGQYKTMGQCTDRIKDLSQKNHWTAKETGKLACMPVITSQMGEPL